MGDPYKVGVFMIFTKPYRTWFFGKVYKQGDSGQLVRIRRGWTGYMLDLRFKDGTFLRKVPEEYFRK